MTCCWVLWWWNHAHCGRRCHLHYSLIQEHSMPSVQSLISQSLFLPCQSYFRFRSKAFLAFVAIFHCSGSAHHPCRQVGQPRHSTRLAPEGSHALHFALLSPHCPVLKSWASLSHTSTKVASDERVPCDSPDRQTTNSTSCQYKRRDLLSTPSLLPDRLQAQPRACRIASHRITQTDLTYRVTYLLPSYIHLESNCF